MEIEALAVRRGGLTGGREHDVGLTVRGRVLLLRMERAGVVLLVRLHEIREAQDLLALQLHALLDGAAHEITLSGGAGELQLARLHLHRELIRLLGALRLPLLLLRVVLGLEPGQGGLRLRELAGVRLGGGQLLVEARQVRVPLGDLPLEITDLPLERGALRVELALLRLDVGGVLGHDLVHRLLVQPQVLQKLPFHVGIPPFFDFCNIKSPPMEGPSTEITPAPSPGRPW